MKKQILTLIMAILAMAVVSCGGGAGPSTPTDIPISIEGLNGKAVYSVCNETVDQGIAAISGFSSSLSEPMSFDTNLLPVIVNGAVDGVCTGNITLESGSGTNIGMSGTMTCVGYTDDADEGVLDGTINLSVEGSHNSTTAFAYEKSTTITSATTLTYDSEATALAGSFSYAGSGPTINDTVSTFDGTSGSEEIVCDNISNFSASCPTISNFKITDADGNWFGSFYNTDGEYDTIRVTITNGLVSSFAYTRIPDDTSVILSATTTITSAKYRTVNACVDFLSAVDFCIPLTVSDDNRHMYGISIADDGGMGSFILDRNGLPTTFAETDTAGIWQGYILGWTYNASEEIYVVTSRDAISFTTSGGGFDFDGTRSKLDGSNRAYDFTGQFAYWDDDYNTGAQWGYVNYSPTVTDGIYVVENVGKNIIAGYLSDTLIGFYAYKTGEEP